MRLTTMVAALGFVLTSTSVMAGLDCARVKQMSQSGTSAADIARSLGLTTPDVQACLAGAVEEPVMAHPAGKIPLSSQRPVNDGVIRRAPDGQDE